MKTISLLLLLAFISIVARGQDLPYTNLLAQLNTDWAVTNYDGMERTFDAALADDQLHPYAMASILYFYVFEKQDYDKANKYADEFLSLIQSKGTDEDIAWATETVAEIKRIPRSEYAPFTEEQRAQLRDLPGEFSVNPFALKVVHRITTRDVQQQNAFYLAPLGK